MARRRRNPEAEGIRRYGPGKFDTILDALLYAAAGDSSWFDDEVSREHAGGWAGLITGGDMLKGIEEAAREQGETLTDDERELVESSEAAIMEETSDGFVSVEWFDSESDARAEWDENVVPAFEPEEEDEGTYEEEDG